MTTTRCCCTADGSPVDTWREDYPYDERMTRDEYDRDKRLLQIELLKLQNWVKDDRRAAGHPVRGAGRGRQGRHHQAVHGAPEPARRPVVALEKPSERESTQWYFQRYVEHLPAAGEIVLFDRSWYNRAGVERVMGFCTRAEYLEFMRQAPELERMLVRSGHPPGQVLVLGVPGRAAHPVRDPAGRPGAAVEALPDGPGSRWTSGTTTPRPRRRCSSTPTPPTRRGPW